jgi:hypothetical protein
MVFSMDPRSHVTSSMKDGAVEKHEEPMNRRSSMRAASSAVQNVLIHTRSSAAKM